MKNEFLELMDSVCMSKFPKHTHRIWQNTISLLNQGFMALAHIFHVSLNGPWKQVATPHKMIIGIVIDEP